VLLSQDYRSRAIGVVAAIGVLITGVAVNGAATPAAKAERVAVKKPAPARPVAVARLQPKCDPVC